MQGAILKLLNELENYYYLTPAIGMVIIRRLDRLCISTITTISDLFALITKLLKMCFIRHKE